ncbi:MAG TPA: dTMP kinase [Methanocorpusculum sp.]|nr:dTMP kinase [Methanocorpusculum sp.]
MITLEGIDGSGKSTLFKGLQVKLADLDPLFTREPGSPFLGNAVRHAISNEPDPLVEAALFVADHAVHLATVIRPALDAGRLIISDRYSDSRFAYQQISLKSAHPNPKAWLTAVHKDWSIRADLTILLLLAPEIAMSRLSEREKKEHFEKKEVLEEVQKRYVERMNEDPERFLLIDATQDPEKILDFVEKSIRAQYII